MKTIEEIYLDEVHEVYTKLGEKAAKLFMAEPVKKFVLNCLLKNEQLHKHSVGGGLLPKCPHCQGTGIDPTIPNYNITPNSKPEQ